MVSSQRREFDTPDEVDQLLLNARLRDELEPFFDESVRVVNSHRMPTAAENEYLASMLAWERAPVLPIAQWFEPRLELPSPETLTDKALHEVLHLTIAKLYEKHIAISFTEHLSDLDLYCLILRDILPSYEKKLDLSSTYLNWHCLDPATDVDIWLRYYASEAERESWALETGEPLPEAETPPYPRQLPYRRA